MGEVTAGRFGSFDSEGVEAELTAMDCVEGISQPAKYRLFWDTDEKMKLEPILGDDCTYGEPDGNATLCEFMFHWIRFIFLCEDMARRLELIRLL